jgi:hypothetical protein
MAPKHPGQTFPKGKRGSTGHKMQERLNLATDCIRLQLPRATIVKNLMEKFGIKRRSAYLDIKRAYKAMGEEAEDNRPYYKHSLRETLRTILRKCIHAHKYGDAIRACQELAKIDGLYAPAEVKAHVKHTIEDEVASMTSNEQRKALDELFGKYGASKRPHGGNGAGNGADKDGDRNLTN